MVRRAIGSLSFQTTSLALVLSLVIPPSLWPLAARQRTPGPVATQAGGLAKRGDSFARRVRSVLQSDGRQSNAPLFGVLLHSLSRQVDGTSTGSPFDVLAQRFVTRAGFTKTDVERIVQRWRALPGELRNEVLPPGLHNRPSRIDVQPEELRAMLQADLADFMVARGITLNELGAEQAIRVFGSPNHLRRLAEKDLPTRRSGSVVSPGSREPGLVQFTSIRKQFLEDVNALLPVVKTIVDHTGVKTAVQSPMKGYATIELGTEFRIRGQGFGSQASDIEIVLIDEVGVYGPDLPLQTAVVGTLKPKSVSPTEIVVLAPKPFKKLNTANGPTTQGPGEAFSGQVRVRRQYPNGLFDSPRSIETSPSMQESNPASVIVQDSVVKKQQEAAILDAFLAGGTIADIAKLVTDKEEGARVGSQLTVYGDFTHVKWLTIYREHDAADQAEVSQIYTLPIGVVEHLPNGATRANVQIPPQAVPGRYRAFFQGDHLGAMIYSAHEQAFNVIPNRYRVTTTHIHPLNECGAPGDEEGTDEIRYIGTNTVDYNTPFPWIGYKEDLERTLKPIPWSNKLIPQAGEFATVERFLIVGATLLESDDEEWEDIQKYADDIVAAVSDYQAEALALLWAGVGNIASQQYAAGAVLLIAAAVLAIIEGVEAADEADFIATKVFAPNIVQLFDNTNNVAHEWTNAAVGIAPFLHFESAAESCTYQVRLRVVREP